MRLMQNTKIFKDKTLCRCLRHLLTAAINLTNNIAFIKHFPSPSKTKY